VAARKPSVGTMIETQRLTKHFKSGKALVKAVDGIDLTVEIGRASCRERV